MRVLMVAAPLVGHLVPLLPLAVACREAGHDVLLASGGDALDVDTLGVPLRDVAGRVRMGRIALRVSLTHPRLVAREFSGRGGTLVVGRLFGGVAAAMLPDVTALARSWAPDVIVFESLAAAGALVADTLGVPAVLHECSLWDGAELLHATVGALRVPPPPVAARITLGPPSLIGERAGHPMRPATRPPGGDLPGWLSTPGRRPRILVSRSTTGGAPGGDPMPAVLAAAPAVEADFVLLRGPRRKSLPPNVHVTGWIPLARALSHATAFVHHGGAGGLLEALGVGVPQLVVPGAGDRRFNAELLARRGAGLAVASRDITAATLTRLITDPALRTAAHQVRAEIAAMPDPATLVDLVTRST